MTSLNAVGISSTVLEIKINGSVETVWKALTDDLGAWWPDGAYAGGTAGERSFHLDARPGGQMIESWGDGGGILWGQVASVSPQKQLQVCGNTFPNWGGPIEWYGTWDLETDGSETVLRFSESIIGPMPDASKEDREKGWHFIYHDALKAHIEGGPAPVWSE